MVRGGVYLASASLSPAMAGCPVLWLGEGLADAGAARIAASPADLSPARLWLARGREWRGPFRSYRAALAALPWPPDALAALARAGRGKPLGAFYIAGGWRYRLAYGGERPPERWRG